MFKEIITPFPVRPAGFIEIIAVEELHSGSTTGQRTYDFRIQGKMLVNSHNILSIQPASLHKGTRQGINISTNPSSKCWDFSKSELLVTETLECFIITWRDQNSSLPRYVLFVE